MDYEEFRWAVGDEATVPLLRQFYEKRLPLDQALRKSMRDFRLYMLVGGMPQAVNEYLDTNNLSRVDKVKRGIIDLYIENRLLTKQETAALKRKKDGGRRLVFAYMSVGEAETYRDYWQKDWTEKLPAWLDKPNENWQNNYRVKFWCPEWKHILYGSPNAYLDEIMNAGFDGAFLDVIDVYQYFQSKS